MGPGILGFSVLFPPFVAKGAGCCPESIGLPWPFTRRGDRHANDHPCLWFESGLDEAVPFYPSVFEGSRVLDESRYGRAAPLPAGSLLMATVELLGRPYQMLNGGPHHTFNDAVSFSISCANQAEVDYYWDALLADGGQPVQCGWLKDRLGCPGRWSRPGWVSCSARRTPLRRNAV